ncbi:MAG: prepilin-type N-terminal cleavage/methylation domain-containing protein [Trichloromonas sp.]|jgi:prepilin-type N-terminal cleavage/methylation domain-containing protein|nr:prepilin-type N-terminal cleavage/methylation domain-containing protein [Trichloromonas sp.]
MRKKSSKFKSNKGMTLVEVLVVAVILSVVVMAVMSLYIPTVQNTAIQTEVSDVQSNLRLAIDRMTDDLLSAGFLVKKLATNQDAIEVDATGFTIFTALVGSSFGRTTVNASGDTIKLTNKEMVNNFKEGSALRLINPINPQKTVSEEVYLVKNLNINNQTLTLDKQINPSLGSENIVIVGATQGTDIIHEIRYQIEDGSLTRTVDGKKQFLARGIENFTFDKVDETFFFGGEEIILSSRMDITLTGQTEERIINNTPKTITRTLQTSVTLRNIN